MTGFDSEADRRDAIRKQIVDECADMVDETIYRHTVTGTKSERWYLQTAVIARLVEIQRMEAMSEMMREEVHIAEAALEEDHGEA